MSEAIVCVSCGDVIGVYEPAVVLADGSIRKTSVAREPELERGETPVLHRACAADHLVSNGTMPDG